MAISLVSVGIALAFLAGGGCGKSSAHAGGTKGFPKYNVIRLYNDSAEDIYEVELSAGGTVTMLDRLPAGHSPVSDRGVSPDPKEVEVRWRTEAGSLPEKTLPIAAKLPPKFHGVIVLRLLADGDVALEFVPYKDLR
jgi:hypothetical protein